MTNEFAGKNVVVLGLGVNQGGVGVARYLAERGARVTVTDLQTKDRLAAAIDQLRDQPIRFTLGRHDPDDLRAADIVVRNPAVPRESPWLALARESGARIEMEMTLFLRACPAPVIGVTGTKGKTTTSMILWTLLRQTWPVIQLVGNMGRSAVGALEQLIPGVPVVVEISSFQLEGLDEHGLGPQIGVVTNIKPDHLDRYPSFDDYAATKATMAKHLPEDGWLITNRECEVSRRWIPTDRSNLVTFGLERSDDECAVWIADGWFVARWQGEEQRIAPVDGFPLAGRHSRLNALAAIGAALAAGAPVNSLAAGLRSVEPVRDRLEFVATIDGVDYINDTTATVPDATLAALESFPGRDIILIAGGSQKNVDLAPLARAAAARCKAILLLAGAATPRLGELLDESGVSIHEADFDNLSAALERAQELATSGDVVLLSPGCASFGMFRNEFERGEVFRRSVMAMKQRGSTDE